MRTTAFMLAALFMAGISSAQNIETRFERLRNELVFPVMRSHLLMGVMPVNDAALRYAPKQKHKIGIDITMPLQDSSKASMGITEIGRTFNLHVANGAPKENVTMVVVIHGGAISSFFNNEQYNKRYGIDNPNIPLIQEFIAHGVRFYVCGQSLALLNLTRDVFGPGLQPTVSAKTAITDFQSKGYSFLYVWRN
ncbi:MAG: DsrE family protein [Cyclobacteriaceae bacterium]|jgi:intracellular sulfur oxidation DsrE/DsrF family protein|nr:DsrE family protein [Cyclobacteriaceae bacterium]